ncbi:MAG TPA: spermidine/putrescine ABC transporter substrate-binding protein [Herpetosiphonaceae bacterium]
MAFIPACIRSKYRLCRRLLLMIAALSVLVACGNLSTPASTDAPAPAHAQELVFYNWAADMPQSVLDAFTKEYGVKIKYETYNDMEEMSRNVLAGKSYDVVVVANEHVPALVAEQRLAPIDFRNIPNFKNISANFRDLAYDQRNKHTVPYHWGTEALVVRDDLTGGQVTKWADLWDPRYAGKIGTRALSRDLVGIALLSLGYDFNSEQPEELEAAAQRLIELKPSLVFVDVSADSVVPKLLSGEIQILIGWAEDALDAQAQSQSISHVLPEEGAILWGDNFAIPAASPNKATAELFINFLLRPEISAQIVNEKLYATPNEAAMSFVQASLRDNTVIFPPNDRIKNAHLMLALSPDGEKLYDAVWQRFMATGE